MICNMLEELHLQESFLRRRSSLKHLPADGFVLLALQWGYQMLQFGKWGYQIPWGSRPQSLWGQFAQWALADSQPFPLLCIIGAINAQVSLELWYKEMPMACNSWFSAVGEVCMWERKIYRREQAIAWRGGFLWRCLLSVRITRVCSHWYFWYPILFGFHREYDRCDVQNLSQSTWSHFENWFLKVMYRNMSKECQHVS